jgi:hypothetical protein
MSRLPNLIMLLLACSLTTYASAQLHVATGGNDANPGSADKPLATLAKAVEVARARQAKQILLHGGSYYDVSVGLGAEDSGLIVESAPGEKAVLFGGVALTGWQKLNDHLFAAALPADRKWDIRLLRVNGRMAPRARFPKEGTLAHLTKFDVPWMSSTGGGWKRKPTHEELTTLQYQPGDFPADLDIKNAEITVYHMWDESVVGIAAHDLAKQILTLSPETGHPPGAFGVKKYVLWNIEQGLSEPGQWYFDRANGRIVYWPLAGEEMAKAETIVGASTSILRVNGAKDVTIRNLTLSVTTVPLITGGFAAHSFAGAIQLDKTENCRLTNLTIREVAGQAIRAGGNVVGTRVEDCDISFCGAGGVYVSGQNSMISNNHIRAVGRMFPSGIGIQSGGKGSLIAHNEVHDCSYSAITGGGENITYEYNLIYDCMKVLHDGAAIYVFAGKNCILRKNYARDIIDTGGYGASAYYLDERSEGCVVEENLSVNVARPSHNHMAKNNTIRNNVFVVKGDATITFPRSSEYALEGNVVYATGKIRFENIDGVATWSKNLLYSGAGKIEGVTQKDYSATGTVDGIRGDTLAGDPLFVDMAKGDWRYKPDSPALKLGLKPVDVNTAGVERK